MTPMRLRLVPCAFAGFCGFAVFAQESARQIEYAKRADAVSQLVGAHPLDWAAAESQAEDLIRDYPRKFDGYRDMMILAWNAELLGKREVERKLATRMSILAGPDPSETPDWAGAPVDWAKGVIHRLDREGQDIGIQYTAVDGRKVDLASMRGKVVLVDFWATWCPPCRASLPGIKASYDKYRSRGFEVIGISWDIDQATLEKFVAVHGIPWPQFFEGPHRKFGEEFGIAGIPFVFLVDRQGRLRLASASIDDPILADHIQALIAE